MAKKPSKRTLIKLIESTGGVVMTMANKYKVTRKTMYEWINNDPETKEALIDSREVLVDFAEEGLFKGVKEGSEKLITYTLSTLGKSRGYIQRLETKDITNIDNHLDELSDAEIIAEMKRSRERIKKG